MPTEAAHPFDRWPSLRRAVEDYAEEYGWTRRACSCGETHYYKRGNDESCQTYSCLGEYRFLKDYPPNSFRTLRGVWDEAEGWLNDRGYPTAAPAPVENEAGTTFLTVAAIQAFDEVFFEGAPANAEPALVAQPSIRTDARDVVGEREGVTTSFVNLATVRTNAGVGEYVADLDAWLDLLSELGLFVSGCSLVIDPPTVEDWGTGEFEKYAIRLVYGGLELGELGILRNFPQKIRDDLTIVDCGFSLERIAWALNRTPSFSPIVGPIRAAMHESVEYLDAVRTLALMAAGGVDPAPGGAGYRFRQLAGDLLADDPTGDCTELVRYYHAFWSDFAPLSEFEPARRRIWRELDRRYNRRFADLPNAPDADAETEAFLLELLDRGNSWRAVREAAIEPGSTE